MKIRLLSLMIIASLGIIVYSNSYYCSFHLDDYTSIVNNFCIKNIHLLSNVWNFLPRRSLLYLSFALNYHFNGLNVFYYHLFNLAIHLIAAILVWWLMLLTFKTPVMRDEKIARRADIISLLAGLIFVVHPIQTEAVTYIVQRAASMAALFYLSSLCFYIKSRLSARGGGGEEYSYYISSFVFAVLAMFTKETAITLPLMILLYEFSFLRNGKGFNWVRLVPFILAILIIPITMLLTETGAVRVGQLQSEPGISSMHYLLTEFRVMMTYVRLVFLPFHQNLDYDYPISKSIFELPTLISFLAWGGMLFLAQRLFLKYRLFSFSIFWFFLTLLPESSFMPIRDVIFEHRLYLPLVGFSIFLVIGAYYLWGENTFRRMVIILTLIIAIFSLLTYQRNKVWSDELTLWNDTIKKSPYKVRPYINRGLAYYREGNYMHAIADYSKAVSLKPDAEDEYNNLGLVYSKQENFPQAISDYSQAIALKPEYADAYYNRGNIYFREGDFVKAVADYDKSILFNPDNEDEYNNRGLAYYKIGKFDQAILDYNKAVKLNSKDVDAYQNLAVIYYHLKEYNKSWENVRKAEGLGAVVKAKLIEEIKQATQRLN